MRQNTFFVIRKVIKWAVESVANFERLWQKLNEGGGPYPQRFNDQLFADKCKQCAAAMDLAKATAAEIKVDYILVSEPHIASLSNAKWHSNRRKDTAIGKVGKQNEINRVGRGEGYVWVQIKDYRIYSCYISPNVETAVFDNYVRNLAEDIRTDDAKKIILTGDINAKSEMWESSVEDERGYILSTMLYTLDMFPLNVGGVATFVRGDSRSVIDITPVSEGLINKVQNRKVMEDELSFSPHRYITLSVEDMGCKRQKEMWRYGQVNKVKRREELRSMAEVGMGEMTPERLMFDLKRAYHKTTSKVRTAEGRIPYRWTDEIADTRRKVVAARRKLTRSRGRNPAGYPNVKQAKSEYDQLKKALKIGIKRSKKECWEKLVGELDTDPFGQAYTLVTKKLGIVHPPVLLNQQEKDRLVEKLF